MAKSSNSGWTIQTTRNSDGSVTYSANGNSVTVNSNWSYSYTSNSWKTWSWTVRWWSSAASTFNNTYWTWSSISSNGNWWFTVNNNTSTSGGWWSGKWSSTSTIDFGWLQFWQWASDSYQNTRNNQLADYYSWRNYSYDSIMQDLNTNTWFASASDQDKANTVNKIMSLASQRGSWWTSNQNNMQNQNDMQNQFDEFKQQYEWQNKDYSSQFEWINNYISQLQNSVTWDISWLRNLMKESNAMFQSKLDAQLTAQKQLEAKFNEEWSKIEWQLSENDKAQRDRLQAMEQQYNANLEKMQAMLDEYYQWTMTALEAKKAWESAATASELSAKWINSAVVQNAQQGLDKVYREEFNRLMENNLKLWRDLNNDYQQFMESIFNNYNTLNESQKDTLMKWLDYKKALWADENKMIQDYVNNVYKPLENYYDSMHTKYKEQAETDYDKQLANESYRKADTDNREKILYDRIVWLLWNYGSLEDLNSVDLWLIEEAAKQDMSLTEALSYILNWAKNAWANSEIYNAWINYNNTKNPWNTNPWNTNTGWGEEGWEWEPEEDEVTDTKWFTLNHMDKNGVVDFNTSLWKIKNSWDTLTGKRNMAKKYVEELDADLKTLQSQWVGRETLAKFEKAREEWMNYYRQLLTQSNDATDTEINKWQNVSGIDFDWYMSQINSIANNNWSASKKKKRFENAISSIEQAAKLYQSSNYGWDNNYAKANKLQNLARIKAEAQKYLDMYK